MRASFDRLIGLLLYAYAFATMGTIAGIAAIAAYVAAVILLILGILGLRHAGRMERAVTGNPIVAAP
jgi:hypothetical protein